MHLRRNQDLLFVKPFFAGQLALRFQTVCKAESRHSYPVVLHLFQAVSQRQHVRQLVKLVRAFLLKQDFAAWLILSLRLDLYHVKGPHLIKRLILLLSLHVHSLYQGSIVRVFFPGWLLACRRFTLKLFLGGLLLRLLGGLSRHFLLVLVRQGLI